MEALRKFVFGALESLAGLGFILVIVFGAISGAMSAGFFGFIFGTLFGFIAAVIMFGVIFLLIDMNENLRRIAERGDRL